MMDLIVENESSLVWIIVLVCFLVGLVLYVFYPALVAAAAPHIHSDEVPLSESSKAASLPSSVSQSVLLSLVIPAYNEQDRLTDMLEEAYSYLTSTDCPALTVLAEARGDGSDATTTTTTPAAHPVVRQRIVAEFVLVDDGSKDETVQVYRDFVTEKQPSSNKKNNGTTICFRLVRLRQNRGKGAAVQAGMLAAVGHFCLMVDADGATAFGPGLAAVTGRIAANDLVLGSRANNLDDKAVTLRRSPIRQFLQACFHWVVVLLVGHADIQDTQCGFKLFRGTHVRALFGNLHLRRWAFDTELLYRATGLRIAEVAVPWHEVAGSKLNTGPLALLRVAVGMFRDMLCVRLCYTLRLWKLPPRTAVSKQD